MKITNALLVLATMASPLVFAQQPALRAGTESGYAAIQQRCMTCHGVTGTPTTPSMESLRNFSAEKVLEVLTTGPGGTHKGVMLTDEQKKRVAEGVAGRLLDTLESGDAKLMPNKCAGNPPLVDPKSMPGWNGWGADLSN